MSALRIAALAGCLVALTANAGAAAPAQKRTVDRQSVTVSQLPPAVTSAIETAYPKSTVVDAFKVSRGADAMYEITVKAQNGGTPFLVIVTPDGTVRPMLRGAKGNKTPLPARTPVSGTSTTKTASPLPGDPILLDQLPKAVTKAIKDAYPRDTLVQAFKVSSSGETMYELVLDDVSSVQPLRVLVNADGKIQKR